MIKVYVYKQSNYPISTPKLKNHLRDFLKKKGIFSDCEVSIALIGEKKMLDLGRKYMKDDKVHDVLTFPEVESKRKFISPPEGTIRLGEIVICYSMAVQEAKREGKLIEDKVYELIEHAALHLLGVNHE